MSDLDVLTEVRDRRGELNPEVLVEEAKAEDHPLHCRFEWDDTVAGHEYRLIQGAHLIRAVRLRETSRDHPQDLRAFVAIRGENSHRADYVPTEVALADPFNRQLVLRNMQREWHTLKRRYEHMREFADMIAGDFPQAS